MTIYFIAGGVILLGLLGWYYRSLLIDQFEKKSAEREAEVHSEINKKNKIIDKQAKVKYDKVNELDPDNLIESLKRMRDKNKEEKK